MSDLAGWPDVLVVARFALLDLCGNIGPATPPDPDGTLSWLPFLQLECTGGDDDRVTDDSVLHVQAFAASDDDASALAESVRQRLIGTPAPAVAGRGVIDVAGTVLKPHYFQYTTVPPGQPGYIARYVATYRVAMRRL